MLRSSPAFMSVTVVPGERIALILSVAGVDVSELDKLLKQSVASSIASILDLPASLVEVLQVDAGLAMSRRSDVGLSMYIEVTPTFSVTAASLQQNLETLGSQGLGTVLKEAGLGGLLVGVTARVIGEDPEGTTFVDEGVRDTSALDTKLDGSKDMPDALIYVLWTCSSAALVLVIIGVMRCFVGYKNRKHANKVLDESAISNNAVDGALANHGTSSTRHKASVFGRLYKTSNKVAPANISSDQADNRQGQSSSRLGGGSDQAQSDGVSATETSADWTSFNQSAGFGESRVQMLRNAGAYSASTETRGGLASSLSTSSGTSTPMDKPLPPLLSLPLTPLVARVLPSFRLAPLTATRAASVEDPLRQETLSLAVGLSIGPNGKTSQILAEPKSVTSSADTPLVEQQEMHEDPWENFLNSQQCQVPAARAGRVTPSALHHGATYLNKTRALTTNSTAKTDYFDPATSLPSHPLSRASARPAVPPLSLAWGSTEQGNLFLGPRTPGLESSNRRPSVVNLLQVKNLGSSQQTQPPPEQNDFEITESPDEESSACVTVSRKGGSSIIRAAKMSNADETNIPSKAKQRVAFGIEHTLEITPRQKIESAHPPESRQDHVPSSCLSSAALGPSAGDWGAIGIEKEDPSSDEGDEDNPRVTIGIQHLIEIPSRQTANKNTKAVVDMPETTKDSSETYFSSEPWQNPVPGSCLSSAELGPSALVDWGAIGLEEEVPSGDED